MKLMHSSIVGAGHFQGKPVHEVSLGTPDGLQAKVLTWGAVLRDLSLPLSANMRLPLTLGFDSFEPYPDNSPYFGAVVGRYANRIAGGRFELAGQTYSTDRNELQQTTLHGGTQGFSNRIWQITDVTENSVSLALTSTDGDQGFPGTLKAECTYTIVDGHCLDVAFRAESDQPTPVNLANHAYFNLDGGSDIFDHSLQIFADTYTPVGPGQIPIGTFESVEGGPFDFRQLKPLRGQSQTFDHNFVLSAPLTNGLRRAARLVSHRSGIGMLIETTKPGLQFYDGNKVDVRVAGSFGRRFGAHSGLCLEAQFFPDSPNQRAFPDSILRPDQVYHHRTLFTFDR